MDKLYPYELEKVIQQIKSRTDRATYNALCIGSIGGVVLGMIVLPELGNSYTLQLLRNGVITVGIGFMIYLLVLVYYKWQINSMLKDLERGQYHVISCLCHRKRRGRASTRQITLKRGKTQKYREIVQPEIYNLLECGKFYRCLKFKHCGKVVLIEQSIE